MTASPRNLATISGPCQGRWHFTKGVRPLMGFE